MWNLETGVSFARRIAPIARKHGFAVALYGSVLEKGDGNDLDLFFVEEDPEICNVSAFLDEIAALPEVSHPLPLRDLTNEMTVVIFLRNGEHIDAHFRGFCKPCSSVPAG